MKSPRQLANEIVHLLGGNGLSTNQQTELVVDLLMKERAHITACPSFRDGYNNATNGEVAIVQDWLENTSLIPFRITPTEEMPSLAAELAHQIFGHLHWTKAKSVLQDWVTALPIRYQGVLVVAMRGYDGWVKHSEPKRFIRELRGLILNPADARELTYERGFMSHLMPVSSSVGFKALLDEMDSLNIHYLLHLTHAIEIVGYEHPNKEARELYQNRYETIVRKMHLRPESSDELRSRLTEDRISKGSVEL